MQFDQLKRRAFITLLGGAAAWPLAARAQQSERVPRVGVLIAIADDAEGQARLDAFKNGMRDLGWTDGGNVRMEVRFAAGSVAKANDYAADGDMAGKGIFMPCTD
jgi:putative ABC transport system substrate-binding protein